MPEARSRFLFIDLLRFVAALFMIQGHVFDAVLSPAVKAHPQFYLHDFFHGFVAPAFLFASGVAFGSSTTRRWDELITWGKRAQRRLGRFLGLIAIGYALHLPFFSLRKSLSTASPDSIKSFFQSDVLQCVGVTLLLLQLGILVIKDQKRFRLIVAGVAAFTIFVSPLTWSARFSDYLPIALAAYLSPENGSWFPLFPWAAYILCGALLGFIVADFGKTGDLAPVMLKGLALNVAVFILSWAAMYLPFDIYPAHDFWKSNPTMFFVRLSVVAMVANLIFWIGHWMNWSKAVPRVPVMMGRESLFIYILHLLIVYGSVMNQGLAQRIGPTLSLPEATGVFIAVFALITPIALAWHKLKTDHTAVASKVAAAGAALFLALFAVRPW